MTTLVKRDRRSRWPRPVLAFVVGVHRHQPACCCITGDAVARLLGRRSSRWPAHRNIVNILNTPSVLYLSGAGRRDRLPDEPVQHRRRGPVPRRGLRGRRLRRRRRWLPGTLNIDRRRSWSRWSVGAAVGRHRRHPRGDPRGQRGHLDDHAERHRRSRWSAYLLRKCGVHRRQQRPAPSRCPRAPGSRSITLFADAPTELYGLVAARRRRRRRLLGAAEPDPVRLRPARHRASASRGGRQRRQREADGRDRDAALRRGRRPGRAAACSSATPTPTASTFQTGLGFTGIAVALLGRNNPVGIAFGALLFAFLDEQANLLNILAGISPDIVAITQGVIVLAVVIAYEVVRRYRVRLEQRSVAAQLARRRPHRRPRRSPA